MDTRKRLENAKGEQDIFWKTQKKSCVLKRIRVTGPQGKRGKLKLGTGRKNKIDYHTKFTNQDRFTTGLCRQ